MNIKHISEFLEGANLKIGRYKEEQVKWHRREVGLAVLLNVTIWGAWVLPEIIRYFA